MFVVMGSSGRVGGAVLAGLRQAGMPVRGLCRRPPAGSTGEDWVAVDALDQAALTRAFQGATAAFVMNPVAPDAGDVFAQADLMSRAIAGALRAAHVPYAVALSSQGAHLDRGTGIVGALHGFEAALQKAGIPLTILRPAYFMESWLPLAAIARDSGELPALLAPPDRAIETVSATDVGRMATHRLMQPAPGIVNLVGPRRYSKADAAAILSHLLGRQITIAEVPQGGIAQMHEVAGLGPSFSAAIAAMYAAMNGSGIPFDQTDAKVSRGATALDEVLARIL